MRRIRTNILLAIASASACLTPALAVPLPSFDFDWNRESASASHLVPATPTALQARIARRASAVASNTGTVGWCFKAVKGALKPFGIKLKGAAAWMAQSQLAKDPRFVRTTTAQLQPGDIMVHGRSQKHPYGHIAVYLGDDKEASDHVQKLVVGGGYGSTTVFRLKPSIVPVGNHASVAAAPRAAMHAAKAHAMPVKIASKVTEQYRTRVKHERHEVLVAVKPATNPIRKHLSNTRSHDLIAARHESIHPLHAGKTSAALIAMRAPTPAPRLVFASDRPAPAPRIVAMD